MLVYDAKNKQGTSIDARETAPNAAHNEMFVNATSYNCEYYLLLR